MALNNCRGQAIGLMIDGVVLALLTHFGTIVTAQTTDLVIAARIIPQEAKAQAVKQPRLANRPWSLPESRGNQ